MTVSTTTSKAGPYAGAGTVGPFAVNFPFIDDTYLRVIKTNTSGVDSILIYGTDYSVSGAGTPSGSVTLVAVLAVGEKLTIVRNVPATQEVDYVENDSFPAESHEEALDKLTMLVQQTAERVGRALVIPASDVNPITEIPNAASRANSYLAFDASGNPIATTPNPDSAPAVALALAQFIANLANTSNVAYGDAFVGVKRTPIAAVASTLHQWIEGQVFNYKSDFGGICNGVADETVNLQAVLTNLPIGSALYLSGDINFTSVNLAKYRVRLFGDARMRGTINVTSDGSVGQSSFFVIEGLMFNPTLENQTIDGIAITNVAYGAVRNCNFRGTRNAVYVPPRATQPYFQDVNRIEVTNCQYDYTKYFIKNEYTGLVGNYGLGDWVITGNRGLALVDHISGDKWDGATIANNTFFFLLPDVSAAKRRGVDLRNSPYVTIAGNKIFEAGADGVLLTDCVHFKVINNNIAYPGCIISGRGIDVAYTTIPLVNSGEIFGNIIMRPSTGGIRIQGNSREIAVSDNEVIQPGSNDHAIVGPTQLTEGIIVASGTVGILVDANTIRNGTFNIVDGTGNVYTNTNVHESVADNKRVRLARDRVLIASGANPQVTDLSEHERVAYNSPVQVNGITAAYATGSNFPVKRLYFGAGGTVLAHSGTFNLKGSVNANPPAGSFMTVEVDLGAGVAREVSRSF